MENQSTNRFFLDTKIDADHKEVLWALRTNTPMLDDAETFRAVCNHQTLIIDKCSLAKDAEAAQQIAVNHISVRTAKCPWLKFRYEIRNEQLHPIEFSLL